MSYAILPSRHTLHPDVVRIVACSATIALNLAVLVAALRPLAPDLGLRAYLPPPKPIELSIIERLLVPPPPAAPEMKPLPVTAHVPVHVAAKPVALPAVVPTDEGSVAPTAAIPSIETTQSSPSMASSPDTTPAEASLAYAAAPAPAYPTMAIRRHMEGTVTLRVLVDEEGKPVEVSVEKSSGQELLDRAAREQVLAKWRFQPAQIDGRHVRAWARVPVTFSLRQL
jgi:protein TonB